MPTRISPFPRLAMLLAGVVFFTSSPSQAGLLWPFRRKPQPPPPPAVPVYYHYPAPPPPPAQAWQQRPYYPPMPSASGSAGYAFGERPAIPAPPAWPAPQYQPVTYRPLPPMPPAPPAGIPQPTGGLTAAMTQECERLARMGLRYQFGSMDPSSGGLDCSGSVKCVLERSGVRAVPRTASEQYVWLENAGSLTPLRRGANGQWILNHLRPGDLLFWRGTYVTNRVPDVSHVMIYLGRDTRTGKPMMFGARSSTSSTGIHGHAVDIYEFNPVPKGRSEFIGFGSVPR